MSSMLSVIALLFAPVGALAVGTWAFGRRSPTP